MPSPPVDIPPEGPPPLTLPQTIDFVGVNDDILYVDELSLCSNAPTEESIELIEDTTWEDINEQQQPDDIEHDMVMVTKEDDFNTIKPSVDISGARIAPGGAGGFKNPTLLTLAYMAAIILIVFGRITDISTKIIPSNMSSELVVRLPIYRPACDVLKSHLNNSDILRDGDNTYNTRLVWYTKHVGLTGAWKLKSLLDDVFTFSSDVIKWQSRPRDIRKWRDGWNLEFNCSALEELVRTPSEMPFIELGQLMAEVAHSASQVKAVRNLVSKSLIKLAGMISPESEMQCGYNERTETLKLAAFGWKRKYGLNNMP